MKCKVKAPIVVSFFIDQDSHREEVMNLCSILRTLGYTIRLFAPFSDKGRFQSLQFYPIKSFQSIETLNPSTFIVSTNPTLKSAVQVLHWDFKTQTVNGQKIPFGVDCGIFPIEGRKAYQNRDYHLIIQQWLALFDPYLPEALVKHPILKETTKSSTSSYKICWVVNFPEIYNDPLENPSYRILCYNQHLEFRKLGLTSDITDQLSDRLFNYDVLIFVRFGELEYYWIQQLQQAGKKVIFLHDENLYGFPYLEDTWELVDAIACTSTKLIETVKGQINRHDHLFLNDRNFDTPKKDYYHSYVRTNPIVGWCGLSGSNLIRDVIVPVSSRNNLRLEVLSDLHQLRLDLTTRVWELENWIDHVNQFDIFVAPQNMQLYAKSHVKISLPAYLGIPIVASPLESYKGIIEHGKSGFFCETQEDWENYCNLLKDPELRREIGQAGRKKVLDYYGNQKATENWLNLFKHLLNH